MAVKGFFSFANSDVTGGLGITMDVLLVATALSVGTFMASVYYTTHSLIVLEY